MKTFWQKFQKNGGVPKLCLLLSELTKTHSCVKEIHFEAPFTVYRLFDNFNFGVDPTALLEKLYILFFLTLPW